MELIESLLLGLIQGLTEFLPISSSGHLVLAKALLQQDLNQGITFEVVVHFGTLCSILLYYKKEIASIIQSLWSLVTHPGSVSQKIQNDQDIQLSGFILVSMIPALIVGLTLEDVIEYYLLNPVNVSWMLLVTGTLLFATKYVTPKDRPLNTSRSFIIGLAQALAIIPGISRSGSTISIGLYLGMKRKEVANFSFLMVIPVIAGAMLIKVLELLETGILMDALIPLLIGFITAFISGYLALKYLIIILQNRGIHPFAWYCWAVGLGGLLYFAI